MDVRTPSPDEIALLSSRLKELSTSPEHANGHKSVLDTLSMQETMVQPWSANAVRNEVLRQAMRMALKHHATIDDSQIETLCAHMDRASRRVPTEQGWHVYVYIHKLSEVLQYCGPELRRALSPITLLSLLSPQDPPGSIRYDAILSYLRTCQRKVRQLMFLSWLTDGKRIVSVNEFEEYVRRQILSNMPQFIRKPDLGIYYLVLAERGAFFHLDSKGKLKIDMADLVAGSFLDDLDLALAESINCDDHSVRSLNWFSLSNFFHVLDDFRRCDRDENGLLNIYEMRMSWGASFAPLLIERLFAITNTYASSGSVKQPLGEIDFRGFCDFAIATGDVQTIATKRFIFRLLDLNDDGFIERDDLKMMTSSMMMMYQGEVRTQDVDNLVDEVIDIIHPSDRYRISLDDVQRCGQGGRALLLTMNCTKYEDNEMKEPGR